MSEESQKKHIFFTLSSMYGGGAERVASLLCNHWANKGYEVTLIPTYSGRGRCGYELDPAVKLDYLADHVRFHKIPVIGKIIRLLALRKLIKSRKPDVIISFLTDVNIGVLLATRGLGISVIVSERTYQPMAELGSFLENLRRITYPWANAVVVQTQESRQWQEKITPKAKVHVIPNPLVFPVTNIPPTRAPAEFTQDGYLHILAVGRLNQEKRHIDLIHAMAQLIKQSTKIKLIILGEGKERGTLETAIKTLDLEQYVNLVGHVGNLHDWYQVADLYVMSSYFEGFPNSLLEAMAYGIPCVSYDCPVGPRSLIKHNVNGLLVPLAEGSNGLATAMHTLIEDSALRDKLGQNALSVRQDLLITTISQKWEELFDG